MPRNGFEAREHHQAPSAPDACGSRIIPHSPAQRKTITRGQMEPPETVGLCERSSAEDDPPRLADLHRPDNRGRQAFGPHLRDCASRSVRR